MSKIKKVLIIATVLISLSVSAYAINMALELKSSCDTKVKAGQTCTNCIKVKDLIKELGL